MIKEFKEFALKGNVIDLAVAVVIAAAFGKVITSMVDNLLMPPLGLLLGKRDLSDYFVTLTGEHYDTLAQAKTAGAATLNYGLFINAVVYFLIVALAIFLVIRQLNRMTRKPAEETTPSMRDCPQCLSPIPREAKRCKFCTQAV
ncbi:MAG TPA: large conductance mechanosensitive channel protein MscL [Thermoanaerobaculia bacterium]|nr:large conductance mechanosensitive channel protein MscL [Thermoanaerobaculia bacterium]